MGNRLLGLIVLSLGLLFAPTAASDADTPPETVVNTLGSLKVSFWGIAGGYYPDSVGSPRGVVEDLAKHAAEVDAILAYGKTSPENRETLATYLLADLGRFTDRFKPETAVDETLLAAKWRNKGEVPWYGLTVDAYLLLELARDDGSPASARRALSSIADAEESIADFFRQRCLYQRSQSPDEAGQEEEIGPVGSTPGAELAWCCERLLVSRYPDERFSSLPGASRVVAEYREWRKSTLLERHIEDDWLPVDLELDTMQYVRRLVAALP